MRAATVKILNSCVRSTPAVYIHVKPQHILVGRRFGQRYLTSPEAFFTAARAAGIQLVLISFRDNQLAREVSSFEMKQRKPGTPKFERNARERFIDVNMTDSFRKKVEDYNRAVRAAKAANFPRGILHITFNEIVHDVCGTTKKVLRRACPRADNQQQCQERHYGGPRRCHGGSDEREAEERDAVVGRGGAYAGRGEGERGGALPVAEEEHRQPSVGVDDQVRHLDGVVDPEPQPKRRVERAAQ